ncbi:MAG: hypothetical protein ACLSVD_04955 [Eggerthellaceae bacterium]
MDEARSRATRTRCARCWRRRAALSKALAAPVGIEREAVFPAENFGSAMAPLYTTLALFIGSLLILVVVKPTVSDRTASSCPTRSAPLFMGASACWRSCRSRRPR